MAQISERITGITGGQSDGWDVFYKARRMIDQGVPVLELSIGEHDIGTDISILEAMHNAALAGHTGYAPVPGIDPLRATIAKRISDRTGVPTGPENILITAGGQAGLFATHMALCETGDRALYCDPYYATYPGSIRAAGALPVTVKTLPENGFQPRVDDILAVSKGAKTLLINSPNNPTGAVYTEATMNGIADVCRDQDIWLISDEVYDTQIWQGEHISPRSLPGMLERTLVIGSMSKSHAMTGSRCGWIAGPENVIDHLTNLATHTTYGVAEFVQYAADFALMAGPELEEKIAAPYLRRRNIAQQLIAKQNVVRLLPAQGAMYILLDIRATGLSGESFADALLEQELIAVMPGESFGNCAAGHLRIAMTQEDSKFKDALGRLIDFAQKLSPK